MSPGQAPNESMINFAAVILYFWPKALRTIEEWEDFKKDGIARTALADRSYATRQNDVRNWLRSYGVFQGITTLQQNQITEAVLEWADKRDTQRDLSTADALALAHADLMSRVCQEWLKHGNGKKHTFVSLTSKALWLCYPDSVPICDNYAKRTLYVVAKLEQGVSIISHKKPEYEQFVHIWKQLYAKYENTIESLDTSGYPHRVRVFDRILWLIGQPYYSAE